MLAWLNGRPVDAAPWSNRGLAYGDGLFETIKVVAARAQFLELHLQRLQRDCRRLDIALDCAALRAEVETVLRTCSEGVLKIIVTRAAAGRGYAAPRNATDERAILFYPQVFTDDARTREGVDMRLCRQTLAEQPALAGLKHLNRLEQVLARAEWSDPRIAEGLMLDSSGRVIEGTFSNVFLVKNRALVTPRLHRCGVAGVMRGIVLQAARTLAIDAIEGDVVLDDIYVADELFVSSSLIGIWPVRLFECLHKPVGDVTIALQNHLSKLVADEAV